MRVIERLGNSQFSHMRCGLSVLDGAGYHDFSAGRGDDLAGGAPEGKRIPMITEDIRQDILFHRLSPSINTRHQGEAQSSPLFPDVPELLDVTVFARG
ncbi:hypothetical protein F511_42989 [Dorcoceras hygrometricum]|uniref:Uncharacterized protein n=1 Tax=Dorcoceras hygrometricum TaxID=472368 RepID=A0A2Z6ZZ03_9LAMI|nr:hypothetical protein F511_42989 [Dorcoceras hygrometricum]